MNYSSVFVIVLLAAVACLVLGIIGAFWPNLPAGKLLSTCSGLLGLASILQLQISGWFDSVMQTYDDPDKFPFGPPSHITRQIIDDPDHPVQTWVRNTLFFDASTGAHLGLISIGVAILATWL